VSDWTERELMRRALWGVIAHEARKRKHDPLWSRVGDMCGLGSASAHRLCRLLGFNPDSGAVETEPGEVFDCNSDSITTQNIRAPTLLPEGTCRKVVPCPDDMKHGHQCAKLVDHEGNCWAVPCRLRTEEETDQ